MAARERHLEELAGCAARPPDRAAAGRGRGRGAGRGGAARGGARPGRRGGGAARRRGPGGGRRPHRARHGRPRPARGAARRPRGRGGDGQRARAASTSSAAGRIEAADVRFPDEEELRNAIERILAPLGRRIDELSPMVDARLADGSRVNVVIPPLAIDGPALSIRRFGASRPGPDELVELGTLTAAQRELLEAAVAGAAQRPDQRRHRRRARRRCSTPSPASSTPASAW